MLVKILPGIRQIFMRYGTNMEPILAGFQKAKFIY